MPDCPYRFAVHAALALALPVWLAWPLGVWAQGEVAAGFVPAPVAHVPGKLVHSPEAGVGYSISSQGVISRHALASGAVLAQVLTAFSPRGLFVSGDGRFLLVVGAQPATLALFDARLHQLRTYQGATREGRQASAVAGVLTAARRRSFVISFIDIPELWELSYDPQAEPIYDGLVHDYRMGEAIARPGFLGVRRTLLEAPFSILALDGAQQHVAGTWVRPGQGEGCAQWQVINLDIRRPIPGAVWPEPVSPCRLPRIE